MYGKSLQLIQSQIITNQILNKPHIMNRYDRNTILGLPDVAKDDEIVSSPVVMVTTNGIHNTY